MKPWLRILAAAAAALALAGPLAAQTLSPTGIAVTPQSAAPGDAAVVTLLIANSHPTLAVPAGTAVNGTVTFTHRVTAFTFSVSGDFTTSSAVAAAGGVGSFTRPITIPINGSIQAGQDNATVTGLTAP
ncbi:MAG: hypothetical protein ACKPB0_04040, partial [Opitutaceae bacterium]